MKTKQIKVFLYKNTKFEFESVSSEDMSFSNDYMLLGVGTATIDMLPDTDVAQNYIDSLEKSKQKVLAYCQLEIESIDDKIQSLLAIGHDGVE